MKNTALKESIQLDTADRLRKYDVFSKNTINFIAAFANTQQKYKTYQQFFEAANIPEPILYRTENGRGVPVVDIAAKKPNSKGTIVMHLPMANSLDPNQLFQVATIVATNPAYRVIAFGNPNAAPFFYTEQNLSFIDRFKIAFTKNNQALVAAELDYLHKNNVQNIYHLGYSYGALKAVTESFYSKPGSLKGIILVDPVAKPRPVYTLLHDFQATMQPMDDYVNRTQLQIFVDARAAAARFYKGSAGLRRQINIAIGFMLARTDFVSVLHKVLQKHPEISATVAWGSESELGDDENMKSALKDCSNQQGPVKQIRLSGDKHALANDVHLHAAIVHEALLKT
jgi:hypothetical protein